MECVAAAGHFHGMASHKIRCFILQAGCCSSDPPLVLPLPTSERQEHLERDELQLFIDPKLKHGMGDAAILAGLTC